MHAPVAVDESRLLRSIPAARVALIERIARACGGGGRNELPQRFLRAYFHGVAEEDLAERAPKHLAKARFAVSDWTARRERVREIISGLESDPPPLPAADVSEASHLLDWMEGRHFVFLGYRRYRLERGRSEDRLVPEPRSGLGILSSARRQGRHPSVTTLRGEVRARAREPELLIVTKANSIATVHRGERLDYVGLKTFDRRGRVDGEHRFLGLWRSTAYHVSPRDIPVLRSKVERVIEHFGLDPGGNDGTAVL